MLLLTPRQKMQRKMKQLVKEVENEQRVLSPLELVDKRIQDAFRRGNTKEMVRQQRIRIFLLKRSKK